MYGPLREWLLGIIARSFGGLALDDVRLAHLVLSLAGVGTLLGVGWWVVRRNPWVFALWWYLILTRSPMLYFMDTGNNISFGWADGARAAFALLALVGVLARAKHFDGHPRACCELYAWGTLCGVSILYSHDTGLPP